MTCQVGFHFIGQIDAYSVDVALTFKDAQGKVVFSDPIPTGARRQVRSNAMCEVEIWCLEVETALPRQRRSEHARKPHKSM